MQNETKAGGASRGAADPMSREEDAHCVLGPSVPVGLEHRNPGEESVTENVACWCVVAGHPWQS